MSSATKKKKANVVAIKSMTGYGKGQEKSSQGTVFVEIKTLNHKSLSVSCNPFNGLFLLEEKLGKAFEGKIARGKVFINITVEDASARKKVKQIKVNEKIAAEYLKKIKRLKKHLGLKGEIDIKELINLPGVIGGVLEGKKENIWPCVEKALSKAINKLVAYRKREGLVLARDFNARLREIEKNIREIKRNEKQCVNKYRQRLAKAIKDVAKIPNPDKTKLEAEVASFAKNCDIAEELTRLAGHVGEYRASMKSAKYGSGKKLDFIAQEMQREANTIGAKSNDFKIAKSVIIVKSEIDRIREQIRNVE